MSPRCAPFAHSTSTLMGTSLCGRGPSYKTFGLYAELPVAIYPRNDLNTYENQIPKDIGALFVTPSARVNIFSGDSVTPLVSAGGGYGRFREAPLRNFYGPNPGQTGTNTGVL